MISIIIPTLNEERALPATLSAIANQMGSFEVMIVDGGSTDRTLHVAKRYPFVQVETSPPGRGRQMNAGARVAKGEWLLFLHADAQLPPNALEQISSLTLASADASAPPSPACGGRGSKSEGPLAGGFHQRFDDPHPALWLLSCLHNLRASISHLFYGDQAVFVRSSLFRELGGYKEGGPMEDVDLGVRLLERARPVFLPETVTVSSRKFRALGVWRGFFHVLKIFLAYNWRPKALSDQESFFRAYR